MIDKGTATNNGYAVGDRIGVSARGPVRQYTITGIARYGTVNSIGGATIAVFDVPTAQALLGKRGQYDTIFVAARKGVSSEQVVRDLRSVVPATAQVKTGQQQADADSKATAGQQQVHPDVPARLRVHRGGRRRVRDLQHPVDHARPAHPRTRRPSAPSARHDVRSSARF